MTTRARRNAFAFYNDLATPLLQVRLKQLAAIKFPSRDEFERAFMIRTILEARHGEECVVREG